MTDYNSESASVLTAVHDAFEPVTMHTPLDAVVAQAGARRRRRSHDDRSRPLPRPLWRSAIGAVGYGHGLDTLRCDGHVGDDVQPVHIVTAAYTVETQPNGTVTVTWTKQGYFQDPSGLQAALQKAGFPVLVKVGEFCKGPGDDGYLDPSGVGSGVDQVMQASTTATVRSFSPSTDLRCLQAHELFIGYLSAAQLAITHGASRIR